MASTSATRAWMAVKPHLPLIKFRKPESSAKPAGQPMAQSKGSKESSIKLTGSSNKGSGIDESQMSSKYSRKIPTLAEMEYIMRGGPE